MAISREAKIILSVAIIGAVMYYYRQRSVEHMDVTNFVPAPGLAQVLGDIKCYPGADAGICRAECALDPLCVAYSADGPDLFGNPKKCCTKSKLDTIIAGANSTLFSPKGGIIQNPDVRGWSVKTSTDIGGSDLACYSGSSGGSVTLAQARCAIDPKCQSVVYVQPSAGGGWASNGGSCAKSTASGTNANNNVTLYSKPT